MKWQVPGVLSLMSFTDEERDNFIDYLNSTKPYLCSDYLYAVFGDELFLKFFDVFAGTNIKVPSREEVVKLLNYIKIYTYCKERNFEEEGYEKASKVF